MLPHLLHGSFDDLAISGRDKAVCPRSSPPAKTLWAVRIDELKQPAHRLPLACLQGLVNRRRPQIFLAYDRFDRSGWIGCESAAT